MTWQSQVIYVVDDDERARESVCALVTSMGLESKAFPSAEEFLDFYEKDQPGCLVTDIRMLGMSGLELQAELGNMGSLLPVIVLTAFATTPVTVQAIQRGAVTLLDKPYLEDDLWNAIRKALAQDARKRVEAAHRQAIRDRINGLTPSERKVLHYVVSGKPNKVIANRMDVSVRTIENRRSEIYTKLGAGSVVDLVRMVIEADMLDET
ncbi:MAG: response regulator transcription factor [Planctomycetales bacterium]|nr:response regulator transcription factor [Planctomycetales bacterium]